MGYGYYHGHDRPLSRQAKKNKKKLPPCHPPGAAIDYRFKIPIIKISFLYNRHVNKFHINIIFVYTIIVKFECVYF